MATLALCVRHAEPLLHRSDVRCPLCEAEQTVAALKRRVEELLRERKETTK